MPAISLKPWFCSMNLQPLRKTGQAVLWYVPPVLFPPCELCLMRMASWQANSVSQLPATRSFTARMGYSDLAEALQELVVISVITPVTPPFAGFLSVILLHQP